MEIGAHTLEHPWLSLLPRADQEREIAESASLIRERLGARVAGLAYPDGDHDGITIEATRACGLEYAVTTRAGVNVAATPRFELRRRGLSEGACLGPSGRFSRRLAFAELDGAFDRLRGAGAAS
jgi:peptidoglycan/xylan/chitin deacetylase (PgdA/CDA1 family)